MSQVAAKWPTGNIDPRLANFMDQAQQKWSITAVANSGGYPGSPYFKITIAGTDRTSTCITSLTRSANQPPTSFFSSNAASVWWVNGQEVIGIYGDRQSVIDDGVSKRLTLNKGANIVRCAVINGGGATDFCARFLDADEKPLTRFTLTLSSDAAKLAR